MQRRFRRLSVGVVGCVACRVACRVACAACVLLPCAFTCVHLRSPAFCQFTPYTLIVLVNTTTPSQLIPHSPAKPRLDHVVTPGSCDHVSLVSLCMATLCSDYELCFSSTSVSTSVSTSSSVSSSSLRTSSAPFPVTTFTATRRIITNQAIVINCNPPKSE